MAHRGQPSGGVPEDLDDTWSNQFWSGPEAPGVDGGVDVVLGRLKGGTRTLEDLRAFYKERASIEEDYAKRLTRLSRQTLGKDEGGSMRMSLDRVRQETAKAADAHDKLAHMMRTSLEAKSKEFELARDAKRRNTQAAIEKALKNRAQQEAMVIKAREKYKADCIAINGYTAQTSLVQGRDLDKAQAKLDKAQNTVATNEKEYKLYLAALKDTTSKWVMDWKAFCDLAQDLEEERLNYMRISLWDYANGVSFICVTDDEFCENIRKALEVCDASADLADFVKHARTGRSIPDPPVFVDYGQGDHHIRPTAKTANFARSSARMEIKHTGQSLQDLATAIKPIQMAMQPSQYAALGSTGGGDASSQQRSSSRKSTRSRSHSQSSSRSTRSRPPVVEDDDEADRTAQDIPRPYSRATSTSRASRPATPEQQQQPSSAAEPRSPAARPVSSSSGNAYGTGAPQKSTRPASSVASNSVSSSSRTASTARKADPLEDGLAALRDPARAREMYDSSPRASPRPVSVSQGPTTVDLLRKKSARSLYSPQPAASSSSSPQQPRPHQPNSSVSSRASESYSDAHQASSSERRGHYPSGSLGQQRQSYSHDRSVSPQNIPVPQSATSSYSSRPVSPGPVAAMMQPPGSRSASPQPPPPATSHGVDPAAFVGSYGQAFPGESRSRGNSFSHQRTSSRPQSAYSPGYAQQQPQQQQQQAPPQQRAVSSRPVSPGLPSNYAQSRPQSQVYQHASPSHSAPYQERPQSVYSRMSVDARQQPTASPVYGHGQPMHAQQQPQQQQPAMTPAQMYAQQAGGSYRSPSSASYVAPTQPSPATSQQSYYQPQPGPSVTSPAAQAGQGRGAPSPGPMASGSSSLSQLPAAAGRPVMFFVRAMYDYEAQDPEEFSFQANDIIAVHSTDSSGWWTGELLDENRRFLGRTIFPSNFCTLLE